MQMWATVGLALVEMVKTIRAMYAEQEIGGVEL